MSESTAPVAVECSCPDCGRANRAVAVGEHVAELEAEIRLWFPHGGAPSLEVVWPSTAEAVNG